MEFSYRKIFKYLNKFHKMNFSSLYLSLWSKIFECSKNPKFKEFNHVTVSKFLKNTNFIDFNEFLHLKLSHLVLAIRSTQNSHWLPLKIPQSSNDIIPSKSSSTTNVIDLQVAPRMSNEIIHNSVLFYNQSQPLARQEKKFYFQ